MLLEFLQAYSTGAAPRAGPRPLSGPAATRRGAAAASPSPTPRLRSKTLVSPNRRRTARLPFSGRSTHMLVGGTYPSQTSISKVRFGELRSSAARDGHTYLPILDPYALRGPHYEDTSRLMGTRTKPPCAPLPPRRKRRRGSDHPLARTGASPSTFPSLGARRCRPGARPAALSGARPRGNRPGGGRRRRPTAAPRRGRSPPGTRRGRFHAHHPRAPCAKSNLEFGQRHFLFP